MLGEEGREAPGAFFPTPEARVLRPILALEVGAVATSPAVYEKARAAAFLSFSAGTAGPGCHTLSQRQPGGGALILRHREGGSVADVINPALANMEGGDRVFSVTGRGSAGSAAVAATVRELLQDGKASSGAGVWAWVAVPCAEAEDPIGRFAQSFRVWT